MTARARKVAAVCVVRAALQPIGLRVAAFVSLFAVERHNGREQRRQPNDSVAKTPQRSDAFLQP
jgi:hypothetical protein